MSNALITIISALLLELQRLFSYLSNWLLERRKLFLNAFKEQKYGYYFYFYCTKGQECHDDMQTACRTETSALYTKLDKKPRIMSKFIVWRSQPSSQSLNFKRQWCVVRLADSISTCTYFCSRITVAIALKTLSTLFCVVDFVFICEN